MDQNPVSFHQQTAQEKKEHKTKLLNFIDSSKSEVFNSFKNSKTISSAILILLVAAIPLTVYVQNQNQDIRQRAAGGPNPGDTCTVPNAHSSCTCNNSSSGTMTCNFPVPTKVPFKPSYNFPMSPVKAYADAIAGTWSQCNCDAPSPTPVPIAGTGTPTQAPTPTALQTPTPVPGRTGAIAMPTDANGTMNGLPVDKLVKLSDDGKTYVYTQAGRDALKAAQRAQTAYNVNSSTAKQALDSANANLQFTTNALKGVQPGSDQYKNLLTAQQRAQQQVNDAQKNVSALGSGPSGLTPDAQTIAKLRPLADLEKNFRDTCGSGDNCDPVKHLYNTKAYYEDLQLAQSIPSCNTQQGQCGQEKGGFNLNPSLIAIGQADGGQTGVGQPTPQVVAESAAAAAPPAPEQ